MHLKSIVAALAAMLFVLPLAAQLPAVPATPAPEPENVLLLDLSTGGRVALQLRPDVAPAHVERIKTLVRQGFYNGLLFHRVIEGFMAQTGDPKATGEGGSTLPDIKAEFNALPHLRGTISMARATEPDSANSQFFIMLAPRMGLDRKYTAFGRVISGMSYVDAIEKGEPPANPSRIVRASIAADNIPPPAPGEIVPTAPPSLVPDATLPPPAASVPPPVPAPAPAPAPQPAPAPAPPPAPASTPPAVSAPGTNEPPPFSTAVERVKDAPQR